MRSPRPARQGATPARHRTTDQRHNDEGTLMQKRTVLAGLGVAATLVVASTTGAVASGLIGSSDIRDRRQRRSALRGHPRRHGARHRPEQGREDEALAAQRLAAAPPAVKGPPTRARRAERHTPTRTRTTRRRSTTWATPTPARSRPWPASPRRTRPSPAVCRCSASTTAANSRNTPVSSSFPGRIGLGDQHPEDRPPRRLDRAVRWQRRCRLGQGSREGQGLGALPARHRRPGREHLHAVLLIHRVTPSAPSPRAGGVSQTTIGISISAGVSEPCRPTSVAS